MLVDNPPRLLAGYGANPPRPKWPSNGDKPSRLAVQFVINYEEGGEHCLLNGDSCSEWLLSEIVGATPCHGERHMNMESLYEYGSRVGFWRCWSGCSGRCNTVGQKMNPSRVVAPRAD